ncbi:protein amalgam-like isoform X2 [Palaemon carinicauda]|uniref:protein amalgam-like isoform X2 n=1 Tax=Palaemon carinicauda TaxID=392227 RepID=UPI0035B61E82
MTFKMNSLQWFIRRMLLFFLVAGWTSCQDEQTTPTFSVPFGGDVNLTCNVQENEGHWVRWDREDNGYIIAIEAHVIVEDPRISVDLVDNTTWVLRIRGVQAGDQGPYRCTVNTTPIATQRIFLEVLEVPEAPNIVVSPGNVTVRERSTITLTCYADGHPKPTVTWTREGDQPIHQWINHTLPFSIGKQNSRWESHSLTSYEGETLRLTRISRRDAGSYTCTANNSVEPVDRETIVVEVVYPPSLISVSGPKKARVGEDVTFLCKAKDSNPAAEISWMIEGKPRHAVIATVRKSSTTGYNTLSKLSFTVPTVTSGVMMLTCVAVNREIGTKEVDTYILHIMEADKTIIKDTDVRHPNDVSRGRQMVPAMIGADINPKRGRENSVYPPRRKDPPQARGAYYNMLAFLRFFGLLMHFH